MALTDTKMGLTIWNGPLDPYDFNQLANDFMKIAFHDHTPGRGVPIGPGGLGRNVVTALNIAPGAVGTNAFDGNATATVRRLDAGNVQYGSGSLTVGAGTIYVAYSNPIAHGCVDANGNPVTPSSIIVQLRITSTVQTFASGTGGHSLRLGVDYVSSPPTTLQFSVSAIGTASIGGDTFTFDWIALS